jgi:hypothetical protein
MSAKHQKIDITIPDGYTDDERAAIASEIIDKIVERTQKGIDKNGKGFAPYSKEYINSLNFKIGGKSKGKVNLTLSGDMLAALALLDTSKKKITIGYEKGTLENDIADGNIRGTYGKSRAKSSQARDFLGLSDKELGDILKKFPLNNEEKRRALTEEILAAKEAGDTVSKGVNTQPKESK